MIPIDFPHIQATITHQTKIQRMVRSKKLVIIHRDLQHIYTGGQYWLAQVISHAQERNYNIDVIDCSILPKEIARNRLFFVLYFIKYYIIHRKNIVTFTDHSLHFRLLIPLLISRFFGNRFGLNCNQTFYNFRKFVISKVMEFICEHLFLHAASLRIIPSEPAIEYFRSFGFSHDHKTIVVNPAARVVAKGSITYRTQVKKILFAGQVNWWKGLDILIKALGKTKHSGLHLDVAGTYESESRYFRFLKKLIHNNGLEDSVTFHGNLSPEMLSGLYYNADIFVMPSHYETYGIVLVEAMSYGLPIIASTIPSAKAIIKENINGLLFEKGNPDALAKALIKVCTDNSLRRAIHENNLKMASRERTWDMVVDETLREIEKLML